MQSSFSADTLDLDQTVRDAAEERPGKTIRIRVQPSVLRTHPSGRGHDQQHQPWKHVRWILECETVEEAIALRQAMQDFFALVADHGAATVRTHLATLHPQEEAS